jgi:hypothetical protein
MSENTVGGRVLKESEGFEGAADIRGATFLSMSYPERDEHGLSKKLFTLDLEDVRAAQYMVVRFDFGRDGWALFMPITGRIDGDGAGVYCDENGEHVEEPIYRQVGFVPSWAAEVKGTMKL